MNTEYLNTPKGRAEAIKFKEQIGLMFNIFGYDFVLMSLSETLHISADNLEQNGADKDWVQATREAAKRVESAI
jgi:hypothetical protein